MSVASRTWDVLLFTVWYIFLFPWHLLVFLLSGLRRLVLSARTWVLLILAVIAALVVYYAFSDRYTPFTTDAYVQAYVVQVAARVEGQVTAVHVRENQAVRQGELLFEIEPRPFRHKIANLEAKLAWSTQQVAQLQSDLGAARAEEERVAAEEAFARAVYEQDVLIYKKKSTTTRKYLDSVQKY